MFKVAVAGVLILVGLNASDFLSFATNGAIKDDDFGVKKLNQEQMKSVKGGYTVSSSFIQIENSRSSLATFSQIGKLVTLEEAELMAGKLGFYGSKSAGNGYMAEQRFKEAMQVADQRRGEFLVITGTMVQQKSYFGVMMPTFSYGAIVVGISNGNLYKVRNANLSSYLASDAMRYEKNNLNKELVTKYR